MDLIMTEPIPAIPAAQLYPGAYLPGVNPGAAAAQYGASLLAPAGPVVVFGPARMDTEPDGSLDRGAGSIAGGVAGRASQRPGVEIHGRADGT